MKFSASHTNLNTFTLLFSSILMKKMFFFWRWNVFELFSLTHIFYVLFFFTFIFVCRWMNDALCEKTQTTAQFYEQFVPALKVSIYFAVAKFLSGQPGIPFYFLLHDYNCPTCVRVRERVCLHFLHCIISFYVWWEEEIFF